MGAKAEPGEIILQLLSARASIEPSRCSAAAAFTIEDRSDSAQVAIALSATRRFACSTQPPPTAKMSAPLKLTSAARRLGLIGYAVAAMVARWPEEPGLRRFYLSAEKNEEASVAPSAIRPIAPPVPVVGGPMVTLAIDSRCSFGAAADIADCTADVIRKAFDDNRGSLVEIYNEIPLTTDTELTDRDVDSPPYRRRSGLFAPAAVAPPPPRRSTGPRCESCFPRDAGYWNSRQQRRRGSMLITPSFSRTTQPERRILRPLANQDGGSFAPH